MKTVPEMLREAAEVYEQRNVLYGDNYKTFGRAMQAMVPGGRLVVESEADFNRLGVFVQLVSKITRYAQNFARGGHEDSLVDIAVYSQMLRELDRETEAQWLKQEEGS